MPIETLEEIRLLSNLETNRAQAAADRAVRPARARRAPAPAEHAPAARSASRTASACEPLAPHRHRRATSMFRMRAAGYRGPERVRAARDARASPAPREGLTRRINILADKSLLAAFADGAHEVTVKHASAAVARLGVRRAAPRRAGASARGSRGCGAALGRGRSPRRRPIGPVSAGHRRWRRRRRPRSPAPGRPCAIGGPPPTPPRQRRPPLPPARRRAAHAPASRPEQARNCATRGHLARAASRCSRRAWRHRRDKLARRAPRRPQLRRSSCYITDNRRPGAPRAIPGPGARPACRLRRASIWCPLPAGEHHRSLRPLYGDYPSREAATQAARRLPPPSIRRRFRSSQELRRGASRSFRPSTAKS